jgi:hypothetical protein
MAFQKMTTTTTPQASKVAAINAATHGATSASTVTKKTVTSSTRLTTMLLTGSGEVLIATRVPALTRACLTDSWCLVGQARCHDYSTCVD